MYEPIVESDQKSKDMSGKVVETDLIKGVLHNSDWFRRWDTGETAFHQGKPEPFLVQCEEKIFEGKHKSVFVPLCGKAEDLYWMYEKGHTVCGAELVENPVKELFEEHKLAYDVEVIEKVGKLYKSKDGRLKIYCADLFDISAEVVGQFDMIYDVRSLCAINLEDHQTYKNVLLSLMKPKGQYYLYTIEYDTAFWPGPPHSTPETMIRELYGNQCDIELLDEEKETNPNAALEPRAELPTKFGAARAFMPYVINSWLRMVFKG